MATCEQYGKLQSVYIKPRCFMMLLTNTLPPTICSYFKPSNAFKKGHSMAILSGYTADGFVRYAGQHTLQTKHAKGSMPHYGLCI
jgi:hypothetical protein